MERLYFLRNSAVTSAPKKQAIFRSSFFRQPFRPCGSGSLQKRSKIISHPIFRRKKLPCSPWTCRYSSCSSSVNWLPPSLDFGGTSMEISTCWQTNSFCVCRGFQSTYIDVDWENSIVSIVCDRICHHAWWLISIFRHWHKNTGATNWTHLWIDREVLIYVSEWEKNTRFYLSMNCLGKTHAIFFAHFILKTISHCDHDIFMITCFFFQWIWIDGN